MQQLSNGLTVARIDTLLRKWLGLVPHPFSAAERRVGILYDLSILQAEFSRAQVLDRPLHGRALFENVIRENLDLGRPDQVQLIFDRRINKRTPSRFRTRVITQGVEPSLHVDYKNDSYDFAVGRRLGNFVQLKELGFSTNRRLFARPTHQPQLPTRGRCLCCKSLGWLPTAASVAPGCTSAAPGCRRCAPCWPFDTGFDNRQLRAHVEPLLGVAVE